MAIHKFNGMTIASAMVAVVGMERNAKMGLTLKRKIQERVVINLIPEVRVEN